MIGKLFIAGNGENVPTKGISISYCFSKRQLQKRITLTSNNLRFTRMVQTSRCMTCVSFVCRPTDGNVKTIFGNCKDQKNCDAHVAADSEDHVMPSYF